MQFWPTFLVSNVIISNAGCNVQTWLLWLQPPPCQDGQVTLVTPVTRRRATNLTPAIGGQIALTGQSEILTDLPFNLKSLIPSCAGSRSCHVLWAAAIGPAAQCLARRGSSHWQTPMFCSAHRRTSGGQRWPDTDILQPSEMEYQEFSISQAE